MAKIKEKDLKAAFAQDEKAVSIVNNYLGAAYLLISIANNFVDEATDQLKKYSLEFRDIKLHHSRMEHNFNNLHLCYKTMIASKEDQLRFNDDVSDFEDKIKEMFKLNDL